MASRSSGARSRCEGVVGAHRRSYSRPVAGRRSPRRCPRSARSSGRRLPARHEMQRGPPGAAEEGVEVELGLAGEHDLAHAVGGRPVRGPHGDGVPFDRVSRRANGPGPSSLVSTCAVMTVAPSCPGRTRTCTSPPASGPRGCSSPRSCRRRPGGPGVSRRARARSPRWVREGGRRVAGAVATAVRGAFAAFVELGEGDAGDDVAEGAAVVLLLDPPVVDGPDRAASTVPASSADGRVRKSRTAPTRSAVTAARPITRPRGCRARVIRIRPGPGTCGDPRRRPDRRPRVRPGWPSRSDRSRQPPRPDRPNRSGPRWGRSACPRSTGWPA